MANANAFDIIIDKLDVMARSRPEDKYALVVGLIERGNVVAVTGDGIKHKYKAQMMLPPLKKLMSDSLWEFKVSIINYKVLKLLGKHVISSY